MNTTPPGWYHASGDPDGTVRWWDGSTWSDEPVPPPPGWSDPYRSTGTGGEERYAKALVRVFASIIDGIIAVIVVIPFMLDYLRDVFDDVDAGGDGSSVPIPGELIVVGIALSIVFFLMVAYLGGTPGKLVLGLRITHDDGRRTPPGLAKAFLRSIPAFLAALPAVGQLISLLVPLISLFTVITDDERRSVYDRIAGTRVVYKRTLD
ncbi:MAG: RDD family protein [Actinomycetota bacterium]